MERKNRIILLGIIFMLIVVFSGVTYAYFTSLTSSESASTIYAKGGTMNIVYADGSGDIVMENIYPRDKEWVNKTFTITGDNTTDLEMDYKVYLISKSNGFDLGDLTYSISGTSTNADDTLIGADNQNIEKADKMLLGTGNFKSKKATHTYSLKIFYKETNEDQNNGQGKSYTAFVRITDGRGIISDTLALGSSSSNSVFNGPINKSQVQSLTFNDTVAVPANAIASWDAGSKKNGSIMAYTLDEDNNGLYEVYVGQDEKVVLGENASNLFYRYSATTLDVSNLDTSGVTNMSDMFSYCSASEINGLDKFDTSNVTNMSKMFIGSSATILDLSGWDTSKVTDMSQMFSQSAATTIKMDNFDTSNVTDMSDMFASSAATSLDLSNFDTSKVTSMSSMFGGDFRGSKVTSLDLSSFDTSNVTNMYGMFENSSITSLKLGNKFNTSNVTNMRSMFENSVLTDFDFSRLNTSKVTTMYGMFSKSKFKSLDLSNFDTSKVTNMSNIFADSNATIINFSSFDTSNVTEMGGMFSGTKISSIDISGFNTSNVTAMSSLFSGSSATSINLGDIDTSKVTTMYNMFANTKVPSIDLSKFDTSNVTDMSYMFSGSLATNINLSNFDTSKVTKMDNMFAQTKATTLDLSGFNTSNVNSMREMFRESSVLTLDLSSFDTSKLYSLGTTWMFYKCNANTGYARTEADAQKFNSSSAIPNRLTFTVKS